MGTPDFAVASLEALVKVGYNVVGVITAPDKPSGRGKKINMSAVKKYAIEQNLTVLQPTNLKSDEFNEELKDLNADLQIVVAFRMLPEKVWDMPPLGTFNLHASLLPQYRGAAPINWAIINGDKETGITTFFIEHQIDTGNILFSEKVEITNIDNAETLHDKLMEVGARLVVKTTDAIFKGDISPVPQVEFKTNELKAAPKIFKSDCRIDWTKSAQELYNFIRGLSPYPAAFTSIEHIESGKKLGLKVFDTELLINEKGSIAEWKRNSNNDLIVYCSEGAISLKEIQLEGKKRMSIQDFLRGFDYKQYKICRENI